MITRYDERDDAIAPGPTVHAVLGGLVAGWAGAVLGHAFAVQHAMSSSAAAWGVLAVSAVAIIAAGALAGRHHPTHARSQGVMTGLVAGAWMSVGIALPTGIAWATSPILGSLNTAERSQELVDALVPWAGANGIAAALLSVWATLVVCAALGLVGARLGALVPSASRPHIVDAWLLDYAQRLAVGTAAVAVLVFAHSLSHLAPTDRPVPAGVLGWANATSATLLWELTLHSIGAVLVALVVRSLWRLPRSAPETAARVTVDGLLVLTLLAAMLWARVALGGPWVAWVAPAAPWLIAIGVVGRVGRPAPPPKPEHDAVGWSDAASFAALGITVSVVWTAALLWPALVPTLGVAPYTAALGDDTAPPVDPQQLLQESADILLDAAPGVVALLVVITVLTWGVRYAGARWTRSA